ncbi:MAG: putative DNA binding domain-containing protein [Flavobacteriaceae bacterium]|nr:putative DNA binding domain-containing protein [Flavobacteriaceae bacterium]
METNAELKNTLTKLLSLEAENEVVEFKHAEDKYDIEKLGQYFSALSNEANLKGLDYAWLVFGIQDKTHKIIGSKFRRSQSKLMQLKKEIGDKVNNRLTFIDIHELNLEEGRVILFKIPSALRGMPTSYNGHYFGRDNESLVALNAEKYDRIRKQVTSEDWSAKILKDASIQDLDETAIEVAKENFKNKFPDKADDVEKWDTRTFLNKAKLTIKGQMTRTAIILLGKDESEHFLSPSVAKIRWVFKSDGGNEKDYDIIGLPLLLAVDKVYNKIRNLKYRYISDGTLFPDEVNQYEPYTIREAINNCIAHQDYTKNGRINVIEMEDQLLFTNLGDFIPQSVEKVVIDDAPEEYYRNRFLATAMFNLKMVDTAGGGIRRMYNYQRIKFFPLPEYDLSNNKVKVRIVGKVLDMKYANVLAKNKNLSLEEIILLDKVQKNIRLTKEEAKHLKSKKLIEGRRPNYFIGKNVAQKTGQKATYTKNKAFDKQYYLDLIMKSIKHHESLSRADIDELLWKKLPDYMSAKQKKSKIGNLISELRKKERIINKGIYSKPKWHLKD